MTATLDIWKDPFLIGFDKLWSSTITSTNSGFPFYNIVKIDDDSFGIEIAVAGFSKDDIEITEQNSSLIIKGSAPKDERSYMHRGISTRSFTRTFALAEHVHVNSAQVKDGILRISLEREIPEGAKPKRIAITS